ncbi:ACT domain-containing protein [Anaerohalosphaera lusitana]|nr:ACT domain-containing protein [Anaerohalosphaera lusitana]
MYLETQFSVFMINKPGVLAQLLDEFARSNVNIQALTMMDSVEHGVLRVVAKNHKKVCQLLTDLNMQFSETDVLCVNLSNKSGALAEITNKLAKAHINISYAYCTAGARGGRTTGVIKVADVKKAMKVLQGGGKTTTKKKKPVKRSPRK